MNRWCTGPLSGAALTIALLLAGCRKTTSAPIPQITWTQNAAAYRSVPLRTPITVQCPPGAPNNSVWGTNVYSSDSSICSAAVHDGRINPAQGGVVTFYNRGAGINFAATQRNGVSSRSWALYPSTFSFDPNAVQAPVAVAPTTQSIPTPSIPVPEGLPLAPGHAVFIRWNASWYAGRVVAPMPDGTVRIHYDGWSASSDDNVTRDRLRIPGNGMLLMAGPEPAQAGRALNTNEPVVHPALSATAPAPAPTNVPFPSIAVTPSTPLRPGHAVFIQWGSSWYPGRVRIVLPNGSVRIHYDGWNASSDENVPRIRLRIPGNGLLMMAGIESRSASTALDLRSPVRHPAL